jgi:hypothetical protein
VTGWQLGDLCLRGQIYYQDLHPVMIPTFQKYLDSVSKIKDQFIYDTLAQVPHLDIYYSIKQINVENLLCGYQVDLHSNHAIRHKAIKDKKMRVSMMDCVMAYLVTVLNRIKDVPIHEVSRYIRVRCT